MVRLLADENVAASVVQHLRDEGHDDHTVQEAQLGGAPDADVLALAAREARTVLTHDRDFARAFHTPEPLGTGVILVRCADQRPANVQRVLHQLFESPAREKIKGNLLVVTEDHVVVHVGR